MNEDTPAAFPASPRHRALTRGELDAIGTELDALRAEVIACTWRM